MTQIQTQRHKEKLKTSVLGNPDYLKTILDFSRQRFPTPTKQIQQSMRSIQKLPEITKDWDPKHLEKYSSSARQLTFRQLTKPLLDVLPKMTKINSLEFYGKDGFETFYKEITQILSQKSFKLKSLKLIDVRFNRGDFSEFLNLLATSYPELETLVFCDLFLGKDDDIQSFEKAAYILCNGFPNIKELAFIVSEKKQQGSFITNSKIIELYTYFLETLKTSPPIIKNLETLVIKGFCKFLPANFQLTSNLKYLIQLTSLTLEIEKKIDVGLKEVFESLINLRNLCLEQIYDFSIMEIISIIKPLKNLENLALNFSIMNLQNILYKDFRTDQNEDSSLRSVKKLSLFNLQFKILIDLFGLLSYFPNIKKFYIIEYIINEKKFNAILKTFLKTFFEPQKIPYVFEIPKIEELHFISQNEPGFPFEPIKKSNCPLNIITFNSQDITKPSLINKIYNKNNSSIQTLFQTGDFSDYDLNKKFYFDGKEYTPLWLALQKKNEQVIKILLDQPNLKINIKDQNGNNVLHRAVHLALLDQTSFPILDYLLEKCKTSNISLFKNATNIEGLSPMDLVIDTIILKKKKYSHDVLYNLYNLLEKYDCKPVKYNNPGFAKNKIMNITDEYKIHQFFRNLKWDKDKQYIKQNLKRNLSIDQQGLRKLLIQKGSDKTLFLQYPEVKKKWKRFLKEYYATQQKIPTLKKLWGKFSLWLEKNFNWDI